MSRLMEHMRWKRKQKRRRLKEYAAVPKKINTMEKGKRWWKAFQRTQDELRDMFPGLIKKDEVEVLKDEEIRSDKRSKEEHRYDYY